MFKEYIKHTTNCIRLARNTLIAHQFKLLYSDYSLAVPVTLFCLTKIMLALFSSRRGKEDSVVTDVPLR